MAVRGAHAVVVGKALQDVLPHGGDLVLPAGAWGEEGVSETIGWVYSSDFEVSRSTQDVHEHLKHWSSHGGCGPLEDHQTGERDTGGCAKLDKTNE